MWWLSKVANRLLEYDSHLEIANAAKSKVAKLLEEKTLEPGVTAGTLASLAAIYRRQGLTRQAIETYRRALGMDYGNVNWRLALARLLAEDSDIPQAIHEAKICLRLKPNYPPAIKLIEKLSTLPNPNP